MMQERERKESRTRIAFDQSFDVQCFASSIRSATADAIGEPIMKNQVNKGDKNLTDRRIWIESFACSLGEKTFSERGKKCEMVIRLPFYSGTEICLYFSFIFFFIRVDLDPFIGKNGRVILAGQTTPRLVYFLKENSLSPSWTIRNYCATSTIDKLI